MHDDCASWQLTVPPLPIVPWQAIACVQSTAEPAPAMKLHA
jgi:hypothetical protein